MLTRKPTSYRSNPGSAGKEADNAIALAYEASEMAAPQVSASARGSMAKVMLQTARRYGIPISKDRSLVAELASLEIDDNVPRHLYGKVAHLLRKTSQKRK